MRPNFIVVTHPVLNDHLGLQTVTEPLHCQAFTPELAIEAFISSVLLRLAWLTQHGLQAFIFGPLQQRQTYEFGSVVNA